MQQLNFNDRLTLSIPEACAFLGIGRSSLYGLISSGDLQTILIGKRRLVPVDSLRNLIDRFSVEVDQGAD